MDNKGTMIGLKKEEDIELDLGLSIGGSFKRSEKVLNPVKDEPVQFQCTSDSKTGYFDTDLRDNQPNFATDLQLERMAVDPQVKREIEVLQRQEAKKKRKEKQQHKGIINGECINDGFRVINDNKMWLKSPEPETGEREFDVKERECKKSRVEDKGSRSNNVELKNVNLNFNVEQNINNMTQNVTFSSNPTAFNPSTVCPVIYPYQPVQLVQLPNGLPYHCVNVVPFWANGGVSIGNGQNVVQSLVNQSFRPFHPGHGHPPGFNVGNGCASDQNSRKAGSNGSPMCSSPVVSDYRSSSHEGGGGSSDTRSHSIYSLPEQHYPLDRSKVNDTKGQSEEIASSHLREAAHVYDETTNYCTTNCIKPKITLNDARSPAANCTPNFIEQKIPSNICQLNPTKHKEGDVIEPQPASENPVSTTDQNRSPGLSKESKRDIGKPPKPQTLKNENTASLPQMPCVSTTGNGPNGKTINGFLYRYTKTEVSIICVCHGTSFSPAEFVQHAGGTDVSHPLKHITVIPSAF